MIELIRELPDNVVGILARGRVTNEECDNILRPAMEQSLKRHGRIRLYYEVGSRFPGAGWDDLDGWAGDDHARAFATFYASCRPIVRANAFRAESAHVHAVRGRPVHPASPAPSSLRREVAARAWRASPRTAASA